jgi:hypothetical protein
VVNISRRIPSMNVPFTDKQGRISPVWYEFLRAFLSNAVTIDDPDTISQISVIAGAGLVETVNDDSPNTTLAVGAGQGLAVNANDVAIDIANLVSVPVSLNDEIAFSDVTDNNNIRKTNLRALGDLIGAAPGGSNGQMQYNNANFFGGDSGVTTNGLGDLNVQGSLVVDLMTFNGSSITTANSADNFTFSVPAGSGSPNFTFTQTGTGSAAMKANFSSVGSDAVIGLVNNKNSMVSTLTESKINFDSVNTTYWTMGLTSSSAGRGFVMGTTGLNIGVVYTINQTDNSFRMSTDLRRFTAANLTASTTQTQGQGAMTADINEVATVTNANDVRTLPVAAAGRSCLVINNGANTLQVFPASGDDLGAGVNTSTTIAPGSRKLFVAFDSTNWEPVI